MQKIVIFGKMPCKDRPIKINFHDLEVPDMFRTSPNSFKISFPTILWTFWTLLSDIVVILKKDAQTPPLKKKFPYLQ